MEEVTKVLPAIALRGTTILPDMIVHFDISRPKSVRAVEEAMLGDQKIFLITQKDPDTEVPAEWLEEHFGCPIELLGHGNLPHRVLKCHHHEAHGTQEV